MLLDNASLEVVGAQPERRKSLGPLTATFTRGVNVLLGPNGTGKTTSLRCLAGQHPISSGEYFLTTEPARTILLPRQVSLLPQNPALPERFTVAQLLDYAGYLRQASAHDVRTIMAELQLAELLQQKIGRLSGGQKQ
ncbi:MAG: ATP-binding cassette domain-containing protein, partial [Angustibacter sp.]